MDKGDLIDNMFFTGDRVSKQGQVFLDKIKNFPDKYILVTEKLDEKGWLSLLMKNEVKWYYEYNEKELWLCRYYVKDHWAQPAHDQYGAIHIRLIYFYQLGL